MDPQRVCSLGGDCEIGLFQNVMGRPPMDLFRGMWVPASALIALLKAGIDTLFSPPLRVQTAAKDGGGYMMHNDALGVRWHAWAPDGGVDAASAIEREVRRMRRFADKFREDVESGDRLFVRKALAGETEAEAREIQSLLGRPLLWVRADPERCGSLEPSGDLTFGWLPSLPESPAAGNVDVAGWRAMLEKHERISMIRQCYRAAS